MTHALPRLHWPHPAPGELSRHSLREHSAPRNTSPLHRHRYPHWPFHIPGRYQSPGGDFPWRGRRARAVRPRRLSPVARGQKRNDPRAAACRQQDWLVSRAESWLPALQRERPGTDRMRVGPRLCPPLGTPCPALMESRCAAGVCGARCIALGSPSGSRAEWHVA
ncbi:Uncharacterised protein [uncultured archaeon]|nr:Uncharacterised protein [uncultured archaeon]